MKQKLLILTLMGLLLLSSCSQKTANTWEEIGPGFFPAYDTVREKRDNSIAEYIHDLYSVEDYFRSIGPDSVLVVEFHTPGEYESHQNTAWANATVLQVLRGDEALVNSTIRVGEYMLGGKPGKRVCRYLSDPILKRAVVFGLLDKDTLSLNCGQPEWQIILLNDDDTLAIWPFLEGAKKYNTLEKFTALAEQFKQGIASTWEDVGPGHFPAYDMIAVQRAGDLGNYAFGIHTVDDYFRFDYLDSVLVVEFPEPGTYERHYDNALAKATVLQVLKGDETLVGSTVEVMELMRRGENGKRLCRYLSDENMKRAVICARYDKTNGYYPCTTPEWQIILLNDDDTLAIWPFVEGAEEYGTLKKFSELAKEYAQEEPVI